MATHATGAAATVENDDEPCEDREMIRRFRLLHAVVTLGIAALAAATPLVPPLAPPATAQTCDLGPLCPPVTTTTTTSTTTTTPTTTTTKATTTTAASTTTTTLAPTTTTLAPATTILAPTTTLATPEPATTTVLAGPVVTVPTANTSVAASTIPGSGIGSTTTTIGPPAASTTTTTAVVKGPTTTAISPSGKFMNVVVQARGDNPGPAAGFGVVFGCNGMSNVDAALLYPAGAGKQVVPVRTETDRCGIVVSPRWKAGETPGGFWTASVYGPVTNAATDILPLAPLPQRDRTGTFGFPFGNTIAVTYWTGAPALKIRIRAKGGTTAPFPRVGVACDGVRSTYAPGAGGVLLGPVQVATPWDRTIDIGAIAWEMGCRPGTVLRLTAAPPKDQSLKLSFATNAKAVGLPDRSGVLVTLAASQQLDVVWKH